MYPLPTAASSSSHGGFFSSSASSPSSPSDNSSAKGLAALTAILSNLHNKYQSAAGVEDSSVLLKGGGLPSSLHAPGGPLLHPYLPSPSRGGGRERQVSTGGSDAGALSSWMLFRDDSGGSYSSDDDDEDDEDDEDENNTAGAGAAAYLDEPATPTSELRRVRTEGGGGKPGLPSTNSMDALNAAAAAGRDQPPTLRRARTDGTLGTAASTSSSTTIYYASNSKAGDLLSSKASPRRGASGPFAPAAAPSSLYFSFPSNMTFLAAATAHPASHPNAPSASRAEGHNPSSYYRATTADYLFQSPNRSPSLCPAYNDTAADLAMFVGVLAREMTLEEFAAVESEVFTNVFQLINSQDDSERLAGVAALAAMIATASADEERKAIKFSNSLSNGLRTNTSYDFLAAASAALGRMARGAANADYVEFEVTRALEWLRTDRSDRRLAAVLTLKELARNAPTIFFAKTSESPGGPNEFVDKIFPVLRDPKPIVRVCAVEALSECIQILAHRQARYNTDRFCKIYAEMQEGFEKAAPPESAHGSLLVVGEMLAHSGDFMLPRFEEVCDAVLALVEHKKTMVRLAVAELIPRLARRCPSAFGRKYLDLCLKFLIKNAANATSRGAAEMRPTCFIAIGQLALALQVNTFPPRLGGSVYNHATAAPNSRAGIYGYLDPIFDLVKGGLNAAKGASSQKKPAAVSEALHCAADLVEALGTHASPYITSLVEDMFSAGLSQQLIYTLNSISTCLPIYHSLIEEKLLQELSVCLSGTSFAYSLAERDALSNPSNFIPGASPVVLPVSNAPPKPGLGGRPAIPVGKPFARSGSMTFTAGGSQNDSSFVDPRNISSRNADDASQSPRPAPVPGNFSFLMSPTSHPIPSAPSPQLNGVKWPNPGQPFPSAPAPKGSNPYNAHQSGPPSTAGSAAPSPSFRWFQPNMSTNPTVVAKLVLSLHTMSTFVDSSSITVCSTLLPFVGFVVAAYLEHPTVEVRQEAALTCCRLLLPKSNVFSQIKRQSKLRNQNRQPQPLMARNNSSAALTRDADPTVSSPFTVKRQSGPSGKIVEQVLMKLLRVAVSDPSREVRLCMVHALDSRYDIYLCQAHHLSTLLLLVQDEVFAIRANALKLLGRLAGMNPAYVLPSLRQVFTRIILELKCNADTGVRESATRTLIVFLRASSLQRLVRPFLRSLIAVLPLTNVAPRLAAAALEALGELALVVREGMKPWIGKLIPHIIKTMQDQSSVSKQQTSLRTLGQIVGSSGYVIQPYIAYPDLMPIAVAVLPGTKNAPWSLRCEVLRTFGILGAVDPQKLVPPEERTLNLLNNPVRSVGGPIATSAIAIPNAISSGSSDASLGTSLESIAGESGSWPSSFSVDFDAPVHDSDMDPAHLCMYEQCAMTAQPVSSIPPKISATPSSEDYFPTVAMKELMKILKDPSLAVHHGMIMQAVMFIFNSLGMRCVPFLGSIVPHMLMVIRTCNQQSLRESLLQQLSNLCVVVRQHYRPYVQDTFAIVTEFWSTHLLAVLQLVERIATRLPEDFHSFVPTLVRNLLSSLEVRDSSGSLSEDFTTRLNLVLDSIKRLKHVLGDYLQLLAPSLVKLADVIISSSDMAAAVAAAARESITKSKKTGIVEKSPTLTLSSLAMNVVKTVGFLLLHESTFSERKQQSQMNGGSTSVFFNFNGNSNTYGFNSNSRESLPARAAQPLLRILTKSDATVGRAIIETLCVICREMGAHWIRFYHAAARVAILDWESKNVSAASHATLKATTQEAIQDAIRLYDTTVQTIQELQHSMAAAKNDQSGYYSDPVAIASANAFFDYIDSLFASVESSQSNSILSNAAANPVYGQQKLHVNQLNLQRAWDVSQRSTREDWDEWMRRFAVQLLREAPLPSLRACADLAQAYPPLARSLFFAAFVACWFELVDGYQENLVRSLETAFKSDTIPPEILQTLLNLAEFMEHDVEALPIDIRTLAELAQKCRAYAKALHYKELEYETNPKSCVEALININKKLDLPEAALGVLKAVQIISSNQSDQQDASGFSIGSINHCYRARRRSSAANSESGDYGSFKGLEVKESFLAKLGSWSDALLLYERKLDEDENDVDSILGCLRCLDARGEFEKVLKLASKSWDVLQANVDQSATEANAGVSAPASAGIAPAPDVANANTSSAARDYKKAAQFCAHAAWRLGKWGKLEMYSSELVRGSVIAGGGLNSNSQSGIKINFDGAFYSAILHIHRKEWRAAAGAINAARMAMDSRFTALMAESYKRAYSSMVTAQMLAEMEEIIELRKLEEKARANEHSHKANLTDPQEHRQKLMKVWKKRLSGCRIDAGVHNRIVEVRSLILGPTDDIESTETLAALCMQAGNFKLGSKVLKDPLKALGADLNGIVFGFDKARVGGLGIHVTQDYMESGAASPAIIDMIVRGLDNTLQGYTSLHEQHADRIIAEAGGLETLMIQHRLYYAYAKHMWATDQTDEARRRLALLADTVDLVAYCKNVDNNSLRVKVWLKLGEWKLAKHQLSSALSTDLQADVVKAYKRATLAGENEYKSWHAWGLLNFRLTKQLQKKGKLDSVQAGASRNVRHAHTPSTMRNHIVASVIGFLRAISLGKKRWSASVQQDMLNFLTVLFNHGEVPEVAEAITEGMGAVTLEMWLGVLPQLLARIHVKSANIRSVLHGLLEKLGTKHPQALMYPLSVLLKSPVVERKEAAESLMKSLKAHSETLVEHALLVSGELIRVAILWHEMWHEGLEEASRFYFSEGNVRAMLDVLLPLHQQLEAGPNTRRETQFAEAFGRDLYDAHQFVKKYIRLTTGGGGVIPTEGGYSSAGGAGGGGGHVPGASNSEAETALNQAWDLYYTAFRRINKQLPGLTSLELNACSPALLNATNLQLGVPGTYRVDGSYVRIHEFSHSIQIITSKQRPRKITLRGDDGRDYMYLLKGHEDLRTDERVMQLFGLVNALLAKDRRTNNHDLSIQRYAVTPLSHNAGVVGWVPHCDTLHSLIRDFRESRKTLLNVEHRLMIRMAPDYDLLTMLQKVEVFEAALAKTAGKDLHQVLWLKSKDSEEWLERRTNFSRSLAVMSMVGYILGLGDRHPSNLMLDRNTGKLLHIDFGDCFEVAMHRPKYPEKIPFRLTRMLVNAFEVSGIEGSYRSTCERTMGVLRDNRDSLIAMLEAFVYDPLISWRLLNTGKEGGKADAGNGTAAGAGAAPPVASERNEEKQAENVSSNRGPMQVDRHTHQHNQDRQGGLAGSLRSSGGGGAFAEQQQPQRRDTEGDPDDDSPDSQEPDVAAQQASLAQRQEQATGFQRFHEIQVMAASLHERIASISYAAGANNGAALALAVSAASRSARSRPPMLPTQEQAVPLRGGGAAADGRNGGASGVGNANSDDGGAAAASIANTLGALNVVNVDGGGDVNEKALKIVRRIQDKLSGTDFNNEKALDVPEQVQRLIVQATSNENLCLCFIGWCPFW